MQFRFQIHVRLGPITRNIVTHMSADDDLNGMVEVLRVIFFSNFILMAQCRQQLSGPGHAWW